MDDFGLTFSPTGAMNKDRAAANADSNGPVQEAIRTLSLRLPTVYGVPGAAGAPSLSPLMGAPGAQGIAALGAPRDPQGETPQMGLEQLLRKMFGQLVPSAGNAGPSAMPMPAPAGLRGSGMPSPTVVAGLTNTGGPFLPGRPDPLPDDPAATPIPSPAPARSNLATRMWNKYDEDTGRTTVPGGPF